MKLSHVITVLLLLFGLMLFTAISITGRPISDAQAQMMLREPTPLESQIAARQSIRDGGAGNSLAVFLMVGALGVIVYLAFSDRTTKLLRAWKSARKPNRPYQPIIETARIQELPTSPPVPQLPAQTEIFK
jgi:hypothetical protein